MEEIKPMFFILMPESSFKMFWNVITLILLMYTASFVPYQTSFIESNSNISLAVWEWVVNCLFGLDIIINFISAFENSDKNIEVRFTVIARNYIQSWFILDVLASFPFQLIGSS